MRYWDASALVPLVIREPDTSRRERQLREDAAIVTWWTTRVECVSALNRLVRSGDMTEERLGAALRKLDALAAGWIEVLPSERVRTRALRLLRVHPLRAADALQLAACLAACGETSAPLAFLCADERLRAAADKEGLAVLE